MQFCHHGIPMELLWLVRVEKDLETWMIRPLFVEQPDRVEQFSKTGDSVTSLHGRRIK